MAGTDRGIMMRHQMPYSGKAVETCRFAEFLGDRVVELLHQEHPECAERLQDDERPQRVRQLELREEDELRNHERLPRHGDGADVDEEQHVASCELRLRESVGGEAAGEDLESGDGHRQDRGVLQPGQHPRPLPDLDVVLPLQRQHGTTTRRLANDRDAAGIAAERSDVVLHPLQAEQPVPDASVGGRALHPAEPVEAQPIRQGDGHDTVAVEVATVVPRAGRRAGEVAAPVEVHQHRQPVTRRGLGRRRRVHVDVECPSPGTLGSGISVTPGSPRCAWARTRRRPTRPPKALSEPEQ